MTGKRRRWDNFGEPLFGEEWWVADQKLFEDSLVRQQSSPPAPRRRSRRTGTIRKRNRAAPSGLVQDMLPGFGEEQGAADGEPVRGDGLQALGTVAAGTVCGDREPGGVLHRPGRRGRADRAGRDDPAAPGTGNGPGQPAVVSFRPGGQEDLAPSGAVSRVRANLAALSVLRTAQREHRPPTPADQEVLARWSGWVAVPEVFDDRRAQFAWAREQLAVLLSPAELAAARRNTLNAHYTDAALVQQIWGTVRALGFEHGRALEPGCGSGNFLAFAPDGTQVTGIELDPVTAGIAGLLYPGAEIRAESFADNCDTEGSYDLAIGNVPFGNMVLHDRRHNPAGHSIHNHFIVKALHLVRPGGLVAVLTSRFTMDARNPAARREIASLADLLGAIRLPGGAHQRAAGTSVITDLLVLRRREHGRSADASAWEKTRAAELDGIQVPVNEYFLDHPDAVLGHMGAVHGAYRTDDLVVRPAGNTIAAFAAALDALISSARQRGLAYLPADRGPEPPRSVKPEAARSAQPDGYLRARPDGTFTRVAFGAEQPHAVPASQTAELADLLALRDSARALLAAEAASAEDTPEIAGLRAGLGRRYDHYLATYGPLNRFSLRRTGRTDPATGEPVLARIRARTGSPVAG